MVFELCVWTRSTGTYVRFAMSATHIFFSFLFFRFFSSVCMYEKKKEKRKKKKRKKKIIRIRNQIDIYRPQQNMEKNPLLQRAWKNMGVTQLCALSRHSLSRSPHISRINASSPVSLSPPFRT